MVEWWDADDERRRQHEDRMQTHSSNVEIAIQSLIEDFTLRISSEDASAILNPIVDSIDRHPRNVAGILQGIVGATDRTIEKKRFWKIWQLFADKMKSATWISSVDGEYPTGGEMLSAVFLTQYWKAGIRHWSYLDSEGPPVYAANVHTLFDSLEPTSRVLDDYARFLYYIGGKSLPRAFVRISARLQAGDAMNMLRRSNTVFMLESLLRRFVYSRPLELKSEPELRGAVLYLLDKLVESGSSAAYRMRDDFVTPCTGLS